MQTDAKDTSEIRHINTARYTQENTKTKELNPNKPNKTVTIRTF